jgi:O-antigen/teichoic acid export membrane protein
MGAVTLVGYLVDYGFNLGLARLLEPHDYGDFKVAFAFAFFLGSAVLLGGDRAAPRVLAPCLERGQTERAWEYLRFYLRNAVLLGLGVIAITWILAFLHVGSTDPHHHHALAWAVVVVPLNAAAALVSRTLQSAHRPAQAALPWRIGLPLGQLAIFAGVATVAGELTAIEAIVVAIVVTLGITIGQGLWVRHLGLVDFGGDAEFRAPRAWLGSSLPMMGSFLVALALNQSDLYFLELLGGEAEVGHYSAASLTAHFLPMVQVMLVGLVAPLAGPAIEKGAAASRATFWQGQRWMLALLLPISALLAVFGEPILGLFGPRYQVGHGVLRMLVVGNLAWAIAALPSLWLQYQQRAGAVLVISIAALALDSGLNLLLIPRWGMAGAAGGTAATLTAAALAVMIVHRRFRR